MKEKKNEKVFDCSNVSVDKDLEYIYNHDFAYIENMMDAICVKRGSIVINVEKDENTSWYSFNFKGEEKKLRYKTYYRWAFVRNTEKNKKILAFCEERKRIIENLEKINHQEFEQIFREELKENEQKLPYKCAICGENCVCVSEKEAKDFYIKSLGKELEPIDNLMICLISPLGLMKCKKCKKVQNISYNSIGRELFSVQEMPKPEFPSFLNKG
jgi:hypothetical protein